MSKIEPRALRASAPTGRRWFWSWRPLSKPLEGSASQANLKPLVIDIDSSGVISCKELLERGGEAHPTDDASFRLIDLDGNGGLVSTS